MKVIAFITDYDVADRIIDHLKLMFVGEKPPPPSVIEQTVFQATEADTEYL
ncbi:MAG: acid--CoA ligase [Candidatus Lokiarchaeia archaeon]